MMIDCFVDYYRTDYPPCRSGHENDYDTTQLQNKRDCFVSCCVDCETRRPYCNWNLCHSEPFQCSTEPCPEQKKILHCRSNIGYLLEGDEVDILKEESGIDDKPDYVLLFKQLFSTCDSTKEQYRHDRLIQQFENDNRSDEAWIVPPEHVAYIRELKYIAERIGIARKALRPAISSAPVDSPRLPALMPMIRKKTEPDASGLPSS